MDRKTASEAPELGPLATETAEDELALRLRQAHPIEEVGGIAHDLNNLMAIVTMGCDLLRRRVGDGDPAVSALLADVADAGDRAGELTRRLLAISRAEGGPHPPGRGAGE